MRFQKKLVVFSMLVCTSMYLTGCENTGTLPDTYNNFEQSFSVQNADGRLAGQAAPGTVSGQSDPGLDSAANIEVREFDFSTSGDDTRLSLHGVVTLNLTSGQAEIDHDAQTEQSCSFAAYLTAVMTEKSLDAQPDAEDDTVCSAYEAAQLFAAGLQYDWFLDAVSVAADSEDSSTETDLSMIAQLSYEDAQIGLCEALFYRDADENYYISVLLGASDEETMQEQISVLLN